MSENNESKMAVDEVSEIAAETVNDIAVDTTNEISIIDEWTIRDKIYVVRGVKVMLDFELAELYGYTTSRFNEQVSNNINKFEGDDFCFYLTSEEFKSINNLMSKKSTSKRGGRRKPPRAFTESGAEAEIGV